MHISRERGPLTAAVRAALRGGPPLTLQQLAPWRADAPASLVVDDDVQHALWALQLPHLRAVEGVEPDAEWRPDLVAARLLLEDELLAEVDRATAPYVDKVRTLDVDVAERVFALTEEMPDAGLAGHLQRSATREEFLDFLRQRSVYHLMESDPQSLTLPRLRGAAKVALAELQYDEYGGGRPERLHQALFAEALVALDLPAEPDAPLVEATGPTLSVVTVMTAYALRRSFAPAAMGHLAAFEATSSEPSRRIAGGARRLGLPDQVAAYYDEHVEADAVHEQLAARDICGALVREEPEVEGLVLRGAAAYLHTERLAGEALLRSWGVEQ